MRYQQQLYVEKMRKKLELEKKKFYEEEGAQ